MNKYYEEVIDVVKDSLESIDPDIYEQLITESVEVLKSGGKIIASGLGKNVPILFIDEDVRYLYSENFQRELWRADCYAVIVSRSGMFTALPYSVFGVYELVTERKGVNTATTMNRLYEEKKERCEFDLVLTEDSNLGYEIARYSFGVESTEVELTGGNASVLTTLQKLSKKYNSICVSVDGAAFGAFIEPVLKLSEVRGNIRVSAPESFEYESLFYS